MKVILDLQACQSPSRFRGIGRYSMALAKALVARLLELNHEVIILLNNAFAEEAKEVRLSLSESFNRLKFIEFSVLQPCEAGIPENEWRQIASCILREHVLALLEPDVVHVATLLADGWEDETIASVGLLGVHVPTALTHYDLIPLVMAEIYMPAESNFKRYYLNKLKSVCRADLLLSISEYTRVEALEFLNRDEHSVVNISSAVNEDFIEHLTRDAFVEKTLIKYGIPSSYLLYAPGGFDPRKNLNSLLEAYSLLAPEVRMRHKLVIASKLPDGLREGLIWKAETFGINKDELILTDYVPDAELVDLYRACRAYVFPSLHEGFGLPVLEAMSCGAVVIASNCTSIPEAHGLEEALFDPKDPQSISDKMLSALSDEAFRMRLIEHAKKHPLRFSWKNSAKIAADAIEDMHAQLLNDGWKRTPSNQLPTEDEMLGLINKMGLDIVPNAADLAAFHSCVEFNKKAAKHESLL